MVDVRRAIGSAMEDRRVGYGRSGQARMEGARKPITLAHKGAGAGRITFSKHPTRAHMERARGTITLSY